jgi:DnaK suppressor protein
MSLTPEFLAESKKNLLKDKEHLENEIQRLTKPSLASEHATTYTEIGSGEDENASEIEEYTDNLAVEQNLEKQLKETTDALERIEQGVYGKCQQCGDKISPERLVAYPSAKNCINC